MVTVLDTYKASDELKEWLKKSGRKKIYEISKTLDKFFHKIDMPGGYELTMCLPEDYVVYEPEDGFPVLYDCVASKEEARSLAEKISRENPSSNVKIELASKHYDLEPNEIAIIERLSGKAGELTSMVVWETLQHQDLMRKSAPRRT